MHLRHAAPLVLTVVALAAAGCGGDDDDQTAASPAGTETATTQSVPATSAEPAPAEAAPSESESGGASEISTDLETKPEVPEPTGEPPSKLEVNDIVEGKGPAAKDGDTLQMRYVGVFFDSGEQFDASWDRGPETFDFTLGAGEVIAGWDQGLKGMKAGGRREVVIPPDLAYGDMPPPGIPPGSTLVFVVDLVGIA